MKHSTPAQEPVFDPFRVDTITAQHSAALAEKFPAADALAVAESALAKHFGRKYAVLVSSGGEALALGVRLLSAAKHARVLLPAVTHRSLLEAAKTNSLPAVCVDIDAKNLNIDTDKTLSAASKGDIAILPHMFGNPLPEAFFKALHEKGVRTVEDSSQAHAPAVLHTPVGRLGTVTAVSLSEGKPLSAKGFSAGALLCDDEKTAAFCLSQIKAKTASRPDKAVAYSILIKLRLLPDIYESFGNTCCLYARELGKLKQAGLFEGMDFSPQDYPAAFANAAGLRAYLAEKALPLETSYTPMNERLGLGYEEFPVALNYRENCLHLPLYPFMADSEALTMIKAVTAFYKINCAGKSAPPLRKKQSLPEK